MRSMLTDFKILLNFWILTLQVEWVDNKALKKKQVSKKGMLL